MCIVTGGLEETFAIVIEPNFTNRDYIAVNTPVMVEFLEGKTYILSVAPKLAFCLVSRTMESRLGLIKDDGAVFVSQTNRHIMAHAIAHEPHIVLGCNPDYLSSLWLEVSSKIMGYRNKPS